MKTHRENVLTRLGLSLTEGHSIPDLAKASGIPAIALHEVYQRGLGAAKSNSQSVRLKGSFVKGVSAPRSMKLSAPQWAQARVYSFLDKGKTFHTADSDIATKYNIK